MLKAQIDQAGVTGLINKGFNFLVLEDCWQVKLFSLRARETQLQAKFQKIVVNSLMGCSTSSLMPIANESKSV